MRILLACPASSGGLAEHANYQARALSEKTESLESKSGNAQAMELVVLCSPEFLEGREVVYRKKAVFNSSFLFFGRFAGRFGEVIDRSMKILCEQLRLAWEVLCRKPDAVLLASYAEYLSPIWVWPHWILARYYGIIYVANLHDPVRDFVVGPKWWHDLSVRMAYLPISVGVVHQRLQDPSPVPSHVHVVEAPVGVYDLQESPENPEAIRKAWGVGGRVAPEADSGNLIAEDGGSISPEDRRPKIGDRENTAPEALALDSGCASLDTSAPADVVFLAFGFIRDNKNLDLVIRALVDCPEAVLVVMGRAQSKKDKPLEFYRNLAAELGVQDRVKFFDGFVPDEKLASYFAAADVVVLTYDKSFHSQSGVLNIAARARRPVLASAGDSPLKDCVQRFRLGVFVEPDDLGALQVGIKKVASVEWRVVGGEPDWEGYEAFASWDVNISKILEGVEKVRKKQIPVEKRR